MWSGEIFLINFLSYHPPNILGLKGGDSNSVLCLSTNACMSMLMRTLIGHWLQGNLHAEHFLLVTRLSLFFGTSRSNWKAGPYLKI